MPGPTPPFDPSRPKATDAFRTIGELAAELGVAPHVLRYWETRFEQLRPLQRAGNRRYYRPVDADLARRIHRWLNVEGYTVRGVQALLARGGGEQPEAAAPSAAPRPASGPDTRPQDGNRLAALVALRDRLQAALDADGAD